MMGVGSSIDELVALSAKGSLGAQADWAAAFQKAAAAMDTATDQVSTERSIFGSQMNRLSYVSTNLQAQSTNLQNSRSAIIDTNFASETASLTKGQIMQQAATAMLAQANQMPNVILSLLK
jgi:flagellin